MIEFVHRLDDLGAWSVAVVGGLAAVGTAIRWLYKRMCRVVRWGQELGARLERVDRLATSAEYHSRPNGGQSAYDKLMAEVRATRRRLDEHIEQAASVADEHAEAITYLVAHLPAHTPDPDQAP